MKRKLKKRWLKVMGVLIIITIIITFGVNTFIAHKVVSSMSDMRVVKNEHTLDEYNLVGEEIYVDSHDGIRIHAYIVLNENSRGNVVILHGMDGMDATSLLDYAKFVYDAGYTPINVNMRAHGKSKGEQISFGYNEVYDVLAVIDYLKTDQRFNSQPIILYGLSMGGSTAINVAAISDDVAAVIAVSPYQSYQKQVEDYMLRDGAPKAFIKIFMPSVNLILAQKFGVRPIRENTANSIKNIGDMPILIIHGDNDIQTDVSHSLYLYNTCESENKELWIVPGKDHLIEDDVLANNSEYYRLKVIAFFNEIID